MSRFLLLLLVCACAGSLVDHSGAGGPCPDGKLKCANGCCNATELSAGTSHTCAVAGEEARCWGANDQLQLGHASQDSYVPVKADVPGKVSAIAAGAAHTCAIADGKVWCWGDNTYGQLGNGNTTRSATPQEVAGLSDMEFLAAGGGHTCAASRSKMACWGRDDFGQLGNGGSLGEQHLEPTTVINVDALVKIAAGDAHTCAATGSGVLCWGQNSSGQLGNGAASPPSSTPAPVSPALSATFLGLGANHSCAGTASGDLYCWGANESGQVSVSVGTQPSPQKVRSGVEVVVGGLVHTCAVRTSSHTLRCWGSNDDHQLGPVGGEDNHDVPLQGDVVQAAAGSRHTCALVGGNVWCWGSNDGGQLGTDPKITASTENPTAVSGR